MQLETGFWATLWREARDSSPMVRRRCRSEIESIAYWSRRAPQFARQTGGPRGGGGYPDVVRFLEDEGALEPGISVLDIGAGSGNLALPLARKGSRVTALEPAETMREVLRQRAAAENLTNISFINSAWQDIEVARDGLAGRFDLVLASMTPGVRDPADLDKMLIASRRFCYYSSFSGERWDQAQRDLWRIFFQGEELTGNPGDIIYPFNYLYNLGYRPGLRFSFETRVREKPDDESVDDLTEFFWQYLDISRPVRRTIEDYVRQRSVNGCFRRESAICRGMMLWRVDRRIDDGQRGT